MVAAGTGSSFATSSEGASEDVEGAGPVLRQPSHWEYFGS